MQIHRYGYAWPRELVVRYSDDRVSLAIAKALGLDAHAVEDQQVEHHAGVLAEVARHSRRGRGMVDVRCQRFTSSLQKIGDVCDPKRLGIESLLLDARPAVTTN